MVSLSVRTVNLGATMPEFVRCADCGFLALRKRDTRELVEMEGPIRKTGEMPNEWAPGGTKVQAIYENQPICFVSACDLPDERRKISELNRHQSIDQNTVAVVEDKRLCEGFVPWHQGRTPKEHLEMILESDRLKWQTEREEADRRDRREREKAQQEFQAEQAVLADARHRRSERGNWLRMLAAAVVGAMLTQVGNMLTRDKQPPPQPKSSPPPTTVNVQMRWPWEE